MADDMGAAGQVIGAVTVAAGGVQVAAAPLTAGTTGVTGGGTMALGGEMIAYGAATQMIGKFAKYVVATRAGHGSSEAKAFSLNNLSLVGAVTKFVPAQFASAVAGSTIPKSGSSTCQIDD